MKTQCAVITAILLVLFLAGCSKSPESGQNVQMANPASLYCTENSGKLEIRTAADGSQSGYCIFENGAECEEWAYYRGNCTNEKNAAIPDEGTNATEVAAVRAAAKKLEIPQYVENNCVGFLAGAPEEMNTIALIGAGWVRPHEGPFVWGWLEKTKGDFDFSETDTWIDEAQEDKVAILGTIWPYADWDQAECHKSECEVAVEDQFYPKTKMGFIGGIPKSRCAPCSLQDYKNFVSKLVERYDGDGADDMPSLAMPVKYWEVLNEPEMKENFLTFYKGSREEYVEILQASHEAIKSSCPDCKVVQGGAAGIQESMLSYWKSIFELGGANYFDIANIHYVKSGDLSTLNVKDFKNLMLETGVTKPVWVTEAEYNSENEVENSVEGAITAGASKIFFTRFEAGRAGPPRPGEYSKAYGKAVTNCK